MWDQLNHYGKVYRIVCSGEVRFRVTIKPNQDAPTVKPWNGF